MSFEEDVTHHKLHNILIWSINFVFLAEPKLPWPGAKLSLLKSRPGYWIMDSDKLHNSSTFSSMAEHISPDTLPWCWAPAFTQETTRMSATVTPSLPQRLCQLVRLPELCFKRHKHSLWDAYTFNSITSKRCTIFQTPGPEMKWARMEIATNRNSSYSRIATIIPSCRGTPTPTSHAEDRYCFHILIIWKTVKIF